jgi:hypothetical protein
MADYSNCKDERDRSDKDCVCGGHNASNVKHNKKHNSTKAKLNIRRSRRQRQKMRWRLAYG